MPPSSSASPEAATVLPVQHQPRAIPAQRILPSKDVSDEDIADSYATFILYCNPQFRLDIDTTELKRIFRSPPRSDGKEFSIFTLWALIQKFDSKEIKTWAQLALDLGVEPPSAERGGSVQKVQQYSVRLKRWMHAMHVDAFFEYLLGKRHSYFIDLPPQTDPYPAQGRDGVPAEEDLAIRALDPAFRPKRGRKRNESPDGSPAPPKRPLLTTSFTFEGQTLYAQPQSAHPVSAIPLSARPENHINDPWAVASAVTPDSFASRQMQPQSAIAMRPSQTLHWQIHDPHETPATPHPMSAIEPRTTGLANVAVEEPKSAVTPNSRSRSRRKHGPAVSSAWPSSNSSTSTKLRGRPPGNRIVQEGPYTTFPVDPSAEKSPSQRSTPTITLAASTETNAPLLAPDMRASPVARQHEPAPEGRNVQTRPERMSLQVQVPQHTGRPIRLVTPTVLVNGEANGSSGDDSVISSIQENHNALHDEYAHARPSEAEDGPAHLPQSSHSTQATEPGFAYEAAKRILAADLLRAKVTGRDERLYIDEAKRLADAMLLRFGLPRSDSANNVDDAVRISAGSWLGISPQLGYGAGHPCAEKSVVVHRFAVHDDGTETPLEPGQTAHKTKDKFDVTWSCGFGGVAGRFAVTSVELGPDLVVDRQQDPEWRAEQIAASVAGQPPQDVDWRTKFMALDLSLRLMKGQFRALQQKVLSAVL
ncbi:hypothetical protein MBLNU459_g4914t1 [Dothideomycetes sp. NU459]